MRRDKGMHGEEGRGDGQGGGCVDGRAREHRKDIRLLNEIPIWCRGELSEQYNTVLHWYR
jgi:hypothetical protein